MAVVEAIYLASRESGPVFGVEQVEAVPGKGLVGDRHYAEDGHEEDRDLTLIEAEAVEALARDTGIELGPGGSRRNVVTRGIGLNDLVGKRFRVGSIECLGVEPCDPCRHLERLTEPGVLKGLANRGGLRAAIVSGGTLHVGDEVSELPGPVQPGGRC